MSALKNQLLACVTQLGQNKSVISFSAPVGFDFLTPPAITTNCCFCRSLGNSPYRKPLKTHWLGMEETVKCTSQQFYLVINSIFWQNCHMAYFLFFLMFSSFSLEISVFLLFQKIPLLGEISFLILL